MKLKKLFSFLLVGAIASTSVMLSSCSDDDENDPLVGTYIFTSGTMVNTINVVLPMATTIGTVPAADQTTTTLIVSGGLYASSPCTDPTTARTELRADGTLWNVCAGSSTEDQQGSWVINDSRNQLTMTVTVDGLGSFDVVLSSFVDNGITISGRIENFPLGLDLNYALGATLDANSPMYNIDPTNNPTNVNFQPVAVDVIFTRTSL